MDCCEHHLKMGGTWNTQTWILQEMEGGECRRGEERRGEERRGEELSTASFLVLLRVHFERDLLPLVSIHLISISRLLQILVVALAASGISSHFWSPLTEVSRCCRASAPCVVWPRQLLGLVEQMLFCRWSLLLFLSKSGSVSVKKNPGLSLCAIRVLLHGTGMDRARVFPNRSCCGRRSMPYGITAAPCSLLSPCLRLL